MAEARPLLPKYTFGNANRLIMEAWATTITQVLGEGNPTTLTPAQMTFRARAEFFHKFGLRAVFYSENPEPSAADKSPIDFNIPTLSLGYVSDAPAEQVSLTPVPNVSITLPIVNLPRVNHAAYNSTAAAAARVPGVTATNSTGPDSVHKTVGAAPTNMPQTKGASHITTPQVDVAGSATSLSKKSNGNSRITSSQENVNYAPAEKKKSLSSCSSTTFLSQFWSPSTKENTQDSSHREQRVHPGHSRVTVTTPQENIGNVPVKKYLSSSTTLAVPSTEQNTRDPSLRDQRVNSHKSRITTPQELIDNVSAEKEKSLSNSTSVPPPSSYSQQDFRDSSHTDKRLKLEDSPNTTTSIISSNIPPHPPPPNLSGSTLSSQIPRQLPARQGSTSASSSLKRKAEDDLRTRVTRSWPVDKFWNFQHDPSHGVGYVQYPRYLREELQERRNAIQGRFGVVILFGRFEGAEQTGEIYISGAKGRAAAAENEFKRILKNLDD